MVPQGAFFSELLCNELPVHIIPESFYECGTVVAVVDVVGVFPDIQSEERGFVGLCGSLCIVKTFHCKFSIRRSCQPRPPRTKVRRSHIRKLILELFKRPKVSIDCRGELVAGLL